MLAQRGSDKEVGERHTDSVHFQHFLLFKSLLWTSRTLLLQPLNKQDTSSAAFEQAGHFFCSLWTSRTLLLQPLNKQDTSSAASDTAVLSGSRQTPPSLTELQTKRELYKACHLTQTHLGQACMGPGSQSHRSGNNRDQDSGLNAVATWCSLTPRSWPSGDHHGTDHSV